MSTHRAGRARRSYKVGGEEEGALDRTKRRLRPGDRVELGDGTRFTNCSPFTVEIELEYPANMSCRTVRVSELARSIADKYGETEISGMYQDLGGSE